MILLCEILGNGGKVALVQVSPIPYTTIRYFGRIELKLRNRRFQILIVILDPIPDSEQSD